jgi:hypothetical protein
MPEFVPSVTEFDSRNYLKLICLKNLGPKTHFLICKAVYDCDYETLIHVEEGGEVCPYGKVLESNKLILQSTQKLTIMLFCVGVNGIVCIMFGRPSKKINISVAFTLFL